MILRVFVETSTIAGGAQLRAGDQEQELVIMTLVAAVTRTLH